MFYLVAFYFQFGCIFKILISIFVVISILEIFWCLVCVLMQFLNPNHNNSLVIKTCVNVIVNSKLVHFNFGLVEML